VYEVAHHLRQPRPRLPGGVWWAAVSREQHLLRDIVACVTRKVACQSANSCGVAQQFLGPDVTAARHLPGYYPRPADLLAVRHAPHVSRHAARFAPPRGKRRP
jgi:hypothetical protein